MRSGPHKSFEADVRGRLRDGGSGRLRERARRLRRGRREGVLGRGRRPEGPRGHAHLRGEVGMRILTKLDRTRSRLYRSQILQVTMRLKALAEIYTMHSFAQL